MLLHRMLARAADRSPESAALRCAGSTMTYGELFRQSNGLAHWLAETGLEKQQRVAVLLGKGLEVPVGFYGALAAGGTLVPIDPKTPAERVGQILRATGATHLVTEPGKQALVERAVAGGSSLAHVLGIEALAGASVECHPWQVIDEQAADSPPEVAVIDLDPSYLLHTSGSTGTPKLILHTHRSAMSFVEWAVKEYSLTPRDRLTNHSSHHTCFATFDYYAAAAAAATTVILTPAELMMPTSLATLLETEGVTVWYSVPAALIQLSLRGGLEERNLEAMRWILFAGETFPEKHLRRIMEQIPAARFSHVYGSTEVNVCTYYHLPPAEELEFPLPIGRACDHSQVSLLDDNLQSVDAGGAGELLVRGSTVMKGYWDDAERNRQVLLRRPAAGGFEEVAFRTGDHARLGDDGNFTFVARTDLQVKIRGHRVELGEVETALLSLDEVEEAAAIAVPDGEGSAALRSAVVVNPATSPEEAEMLAALRNVLPSHAVPTEITVLPALPRTPTGKVDRRALAESLTIEESYTHD